jgi:adenylate cyclase
MPRDVLSRRLAVIVAADVVGYSRLMEADEIGTLDQLRAIRKELIGPKIIEHRGRLVKTAGDGLLMEFGSVTDGVQSAIEIQEAPSERNAAVPAHRRLLFRMGIDLGEIITEGEDIYGTGVNVAARLESLADPGGICVSASVHEQIQSLQGLGFEDLGEQLVKNLSRPMRSFALRTLSSDPIAYQRVSRFQASEGHAEAAVHRRVPSIAVLPFTNLSDDTEQEYFADGIAEDIITALSKISNLFVISRNSTFAYKGKAQDVHAVGRELNVRYVLEGSVRKAGDRVRVTAQLVEAAGRQQLWAVRFDRDLTDIFAPPGRDHLQCGLGATCLPGRGRAGRRLASRHQEFRRLGKSDAGLAAVPAFHQGRQQQGADAVPARGRARFALRHGLCLAGLDLLGGGALPLDRFTQ